MVKHLLGLIAVAICSPIIAGVALFIFGIVATIVAFIALVAVTVIIGIILYFSLMIPYKFVVD